MNLDPTSIAFAVILVLIALTIPTGYKLTRLLISRMENQTIAEVALNIVTAIEQFLVIDNEEKLALAMSNLKRFTEQIGLKFNDEQIRMIVEAAVFQMKRQKNGDRPNNG